MKRTLPFRAAVRSSWQNIVRGGYPIEEEGLPRYCPQRYHPTFINDKLNGHDVWQMTGKWQDNYEILAKLGFGDNSTVWLARDHCKWPWQANRFVTLKIGTTNSDGLASREKRRNGRMFRSDIEGQRFHYLRTPLDYFDIDGPYGTHTVLVYEVMLESLDLVRSRFEPNRLPSAYLKVIVKSILTGLHVLHSKCAIIHTDLRPDNILFEIEDKSLLAEFVDSVLEEDSIRKPAGDRAIYVSRLFGCPNIPPQRPRITNFGRSARGHPSKFYKHKIQADLYRAPEVILEAGWTYSADIWNLGVLLWDCLENRPLFSARDLLSTDTYSPREHLLEMTTLLGPPPKRLLLRAKSTFDIFDPEGNLVQETHRRFGGQSLSGRLLAIDGEDKRLFLDFVRQMLRWWPDDRARPAQLLQHPWLSSESRSG